MYKAHTTLKGDLLKLYKSWLEDAQPCLILTNFVQSILININFCFYV